jgi:hypothetical protein
MSQNRSAFPWSTSRIKAEVTKAVQSYWTGRADAALRQQGAGVADTGARAEVTGGRHLNAFVMLICELVRSAGYHDSHVRFRTGVEIPGYYRPTKKWDVVVVKDGRLCAAIELKSQVGPSFGNNFNNRTEEAIGNSVDVWRAFQEGVLGPHPPWLGYFFFLEDTERATRPVALPRSVFPPERVFTGTSYADRYRILCERMVLERKYDAATLLLAPRSNDGSYSEPSSNLGTERFLKSLFGHLIGCL